MNAQQYIILLKFFDISLFIWLLVTVYSVYIQINRKSKQIVQIFKFYYWFALGCGIFSSTITTILVYIEKNLQYNPDTFDSVAINSATNVVIFLLIYTAVSIVIQWIWSHYSIEIKDDRFVYNHLFLGKEEILYCDIDIKKSKYCFVNPKSSFVRLNGCETLYLVMKNGKEYKFKFDENIFFSSPFRFLYPKATEELGIYLDCINLKYKKLSEAFISPTPEDSYPLKRLTKNNDRILKKKNRKRQSKKRQ